MTDIPQRLIFQATLDGKPVKGVWIMIGFGVTEKNSYSVLLGPSNYDGCVTITKSQILKEAAQQMSLALMDYQPLEAAFDGAITARLIKKEDIERALIAYETFSPAVQYRDGYKEKLTATLNDEFLTHIDRITLKQLK
jgi:hypothetical protein